MSAYDSIPHEEITLFHQRLQMWLDHLDARQRVLRLQDLLHIYEVHQHDSYSQAGSSQITTVNYVTETMNAQGLLCEMYMKLSKEDRGESIPIECFSRRIVKDSSSVNTYVYGYLEMSYLKGLPPYQVDEMTHIQSSSTIPIAVYEWLFVSPAIRHFYEKKWLQARIESFQQNGMTTPLQYWQRAIRELFHHDDFMELLVRAKKEVGVV